MPRVAGPPGVRPIVITSNRFAVLPKMEKWTEEKQKEESGDHVSLNVGKDTIQAHENSITNPVQDGDNEPLSNHIETALSKDMEYNRGRDTQNESGFLISNPTVARTVPAGPLSGSKEDNRADRSALEGSQNWNTSNPSDIVQVSRFLSSFQTNSHHLSMAAQSEAENIFMQEAIKDSTKINASCSDNDHTEVTQFIKQPLTRSKAKFLAGGREQDSHSQ